MSNEFLDLFFNQNFNARAELVNFVDKSNYRVGKNIVTNRFTILNNKIPFTWLNLDLNPFKIKMKTMFL